MIPYCEIKQVLSQYCWKNTTPEEIFKRYLPHARTILKLENLSTQDQEKIDSHILHFFKLYCPVAKMKKWKLEDFLERYRGFLQESYQQAIDSIKQWEGDAETREKRMAQAMGGFEFYNKLFN